MPDLSLTDFVDVAAKAGTPKLTKIREIKNRGDYEPAKDFYRILRTRIIEAHRDGLGKAHVRSALKATSDRKKHANYPAVIEPYCSWWGRKNLGWFSPPSAIWRRGAVRVSVNPEIGVQIGGESHAVKLYFKAEPLSQRKADVTIHLMASTLGGGQDDPAVGLLDIRRGRLFVRTRTIPGIDAMVAGEAAYVEAVWEEL